MRFGINVFGTASVSVLFAALSLVFYYNPQLDLAVARYFWTLEDGFFLGNVGVFRVLYVVFAKISVPIAILLSLYLLAGVVFGRSNAARFGGFFVRYRVDAIFLLLLLVLGALVIEGFFKEVWGRARPRDILELGGSLEFSPAWVISGQCAKNCSFMSGHASFGFYFMALGWVMRNKLWLLPGFILGVALSLTRIVQGGHFLSDTILTFFVVYLMAQWLSGFFYKVKF